MEERVLGGRTSGGRRARRETGLAVAIRRSGAALVFLLLLLLFVLVVVAAQRVVQDFVAEADSFSGAGGAPPRRPVAVRGGAAGLLAGRVRGDDARPVGDGQPAAVHLGVDGGGGGGRGGGLRLGGDGPASRRRLAGGGGAGAGLQVAAELPAVGEHVRVEEVQPEGLAQPPLAARRAAGRGHRPVIRLKVKVKVGR